VDQCRACNHRQRKRKESRSWVRQNRPGRPNGACAPQGKGGACKRRLLGLTPISK
jgi:hypothetical protein